jgi:predicted peroxiredoxin
MGRLLVHCATGAENPTRAALAFRVARMALEQGHEVDLFLAGDALGLLRPQTRAAVIGIGTGSLAEHYAAILLLGGRMYASRFSAEARGVTADLSPEAELVDPDRLIELLFAAERSVSY